MLVILMQRFLGNVSESRYLDYHHVSFRNTLITLVKDVAYVITHISEIQKISQNYYLNIASKKYILLNNTYLFNVSQESRADQLLASMPVFYIPTATGLEVLDYTLAFSLARASRHHKLPRFIKELNIESNLNTDSEKVFSIEVQSSL